MMFTRIVFTIVCTLAAAGMALRVAVEHETRVRLDQQDSALRERLSERAEAPAGTDERFARTGTLVGTAERFAPAGAPPGTARQLQELVRLRGEVESLRQQSKEIETLREDTRQVRAAQQGAPVSQSAAQAATMSSGIVTNGSELEILQAEYWTTNAKFDVTGELTARLNTNGPPAVANNDLKGDPELGVTKRLTVVYRVGGVTLTNEFREGQPVILPGQ